MHGLIIITPIPFVLAIFFILWQEDTIFPLLGGLLIGSWIISHFNPFTGFVDAAGKILVDTLLEPYTIIILILLAEVLIIYSLFNREGYIYSLIKSPQCKKTSTTMLEYIIIGTNTLFFIDKFISTLFVGFFSYPFANERGLSHEKHAYLINTLPPLLATIVPLTLFTPFILKLIGNTLYSNSIDFSPLKLLYHTIPYQFYNFFSLFVLLSTVILNKEIGPMRRFYKTKPFTNRNSNGIQHTLLPKKSTAVTRRNLFIGIGGTLFITIGGIIAGGIIKFVTNSHTDFFYTDTIYRFFISIFFGSIIYFILFLLITKIKRYKDLVQLKVQSLSPVVVLLIYLVFSLGMATIAQRLNIINIAMHPFFAASISYKILPLLLFIIASLLSFITGSSVVTLTALIPLAAKLVSSNMPDPLVINSVVYASIGAVISGATFGDINSPLSPQFIIATTASGASLSTHFTSQIIYSLIAFFISVICGFLLTYFGINPFISLSAGLLVIGGIFTFVTRFLYT